MTLTLTASGISPCLDATDDMVITISPQVTADAGADAQTYVLAIQSITYQEHLHQIMQEYPGLIMGTVQTFQQDKHPNPNL